MRRGLSLMEVVIAGFLFLLVALAMFALLSGSLRLGHNAELRLQAEHYAQEALESGRSQPVDSLTPGPRGAERQGEFERVVEVREIRPGLKEIQVTVRWKDEQRPLQLSRSLRVSGVED